MSVQDAFGILKGENDAATSYLKRTTSASLEAKFEPVINAALDKVNATKYYEDLVNTYNKIPLVKKVESDLTVYATQKALDGLFTLVAQEELNIRENQVLEPQIYLEKYLHSRISLQHQDRLQISPDAYF